MHLNNRPIKVRTEKFGSSKRHMDNAEWYVVSENRKSWVCFHIQLVSCPNMKRALRKPLKAQPAGNGRTLTKGVQRGNRGLSGFPPGI
jgi:hypothetical protein